ncbi:MarR family transcriptional regulator [Clostridium sediminicola]|uniref:MarR family winged helix-turn-helix transcriptional regulator n=1 Tax=Clostridium sediminicola TaxID=3114879 RepID=UPI0031F24052
MEQRILIDLYNFKQIYNNYMSNKLKEYELNLSEIIILSFLIRNPSLNTAKEIVQYCQISKGLISRSLEDLSFKGYLTTKTDSNDKRITRLFITAKALPISEKLSQFNNKFLSHLFYGIEEDEKEILKKVMNKIKDNLYDINNRKGLVD